MTTASIFFCLIIAVVAWAIINVFLYVLEVFAASISWLIGYFLHRPWTFRTAFLKIRIVCTKVMLFVSFGLIKPKKIEKLKREHKFHIR